MSDICGSVAPLLRTTTHQLPNSLVSARPACYAGDWRAVMCWCFGSPAQSLHVSPGIGLRCFRVAYVGMLARANIAAEQLLRICRHALGFLNLSRSLYVSPGGALGYVCMLFLTVELPTVPTNSTGLAAVLHNSVGCIRT